MKVVDLKPTLEIDNPDYILEKAKGAYSDVIVMGYDSDGEVDIRATALFAGDAEVICLMEKFKHKLLSGDYRDE